MSLQQFTSETFAEGHRAVAWQDILSGFGLRSTSRPAHRGSHATAVLQGSADAVLLARLTAGEQTFAPLTQRTDLPLVLWVQEAGSVLRQDGAPVPVPAGALLLLPRSGEWELAVPAGLQAVALSVRAAALRGRKTAAIAGGVARVLEAKGLAGILAQLMDASGRNLEALSSADWAATEASLAELFLALVSQHASAGSGTAAQAALLHRLCQTIERRLDDPDLTPARVAQAEGISERYLQKLFEGTGDSFRQYLRERRLQRTAADLANPAEASLPVSEIAFRCGFGDAAHFSRAFRERFGMSPRDFRQGEAERLQATARPGGQRGWPEAALGSGRPSRSKVGGQPPGRPVRRTSRSPAAGAPAHHHLPVDASRVHWGYFSRSLKPQLEVTSGDTIRVETLTQHSSDDPARMILGDPGAEDVFGWTSTGKRVDRRGAGPMDGSIYGRGAGEGFGVHICTGPIAVKEAQPGDVLEVRILDIEPRPSGNPAYAGRVFGSSVAAWWGYHYAEFLSGPKPREVVTIYEIDSGEDPHARALYAYRWTPQIDPFGVTHRTYDYPGVPVALDSVEPRPHVLAGVRIPLRPHFGVIGLAPREADLVDSVPPSYFGGNIDNWRLGKGAAVYLPVSVPGALLSIGDPHAAQGDGELGGTAIECSLTGTIAVILHKKADLGDGPLADLTYPLIETTTDWVLTGFSHPNYLAEFGAKGQSEVYAKSSLDLAMKDAFRKARRFLMSAQGLGEDEAIALLSAAVDFGVTQVVDGNWGVHAVLSKRLFQHSPVP